MMGQSTGRPLAVTLGQATSIGQVRPSNEDAVLCERPDTPEVARRGLFCAVADGMGGHAAGDVASSIAVQSARDAYYAADTDAVDRALRDAIAAANLAVHRAGAGAQGRDHMGSTLTAAVVLGDQMVVGHVGDSRCYVVRDGSIRQLTRDHSWVAEAVEAGDLTAEEARVHPRRNIITRALGLGPAIDVDLYVASLTVGSVVVLCSDGLHGLVSDEEIARYASQYPPQRAADGLVDLANQRGGVDNISAVVIRVDAPNDEETLTGLPRPVDRRQTSLPPADANAPPAGGDDRRPPALARRGGPPKISTDVPDAPAAVREADVVPDVPDLEPPSRRGVDLVVLLVVLLALALLGAAVGLSLVRTLGIG
ncbi:MAG: Stp1/IreP family PP2C-type Ser/Thr phosphatase [Chloroflexota bacterium]|nr:Stp1/IreP family PP2C-type Ser/Thr phosphatase [Chloroflexota bacterium]